MTRHFLTLRDYSSDELHFLLQEASRMKQLYKTGGRDVCLAGKNMVLLFEKPSSRTRISFQVAMSQLGGNAIYIRPEDIGGLGRREPIKDLARVLNGYVDLIVARTFTHEAVVELASYSIVPVINALTDLSHPCQAMADMLTIQEHFGRLQGIKLAYVGDGNNVAYSLAIASKRLGLHLALASPAKYTLNPDFLAQLDGPGRISCTTQPMDAVKDADVIYTDTWVSMGQEAEKEQRIKDFAGYQVNRQLLEAAANRAKIMHCLPAYRGLEITDEVMESPQSIIFAQAENRLHFQRALIKHLL